MKVATVVNNDNRQYRFQNFTGLTKLMKKKVYIDGEKDILNIIKNRKDTQSTLVGKLPPEMFANLNKNVNQKDLPDAIREVMAAFGKVAEEIRTFFVSVNSTATEFKNQRSDSCVEYLKSVLEKFKLTTGKEDVDLEFLGGGAYGSAYRIHGLHDYKTNDDYILKVHKVIDDGKNWNEYKSHGNYAEPNTAVYWTNIWGQNSQRGKFYFADIKRGFMVDNYIDRNTPPYKNFVNEYNAGLKLTDEELAHDNGHNKINGYSIDWGGVRVVNRVKNESKTARTVLKLIKTTDKDARCEKWNKLLNSKQFDDTQKKAGLALAIKHMPDKTLYIEKCLEFNKPFVDQALAYVLKYLPHEQAMAYFEKLMKRNNEITQTVLMNEIPLLARKPLPEAYDDMNIPKEQIVDKKIKEFYDIAKNYAISKSREHLASYVHLLPQENIMTEFNSLLKLDSYEVYSRLLHKIKTVPEFEFPFKLKFTMLDKLEGVVKDPYLQDKTKKVRIYTIRKELED